MTKIESMVTDLAIVIADEEVSMLDYYTERCVTC